MTFKTRDLQLARRANRAGAHYSLRIILEARAAGIPLSLAFALVEQESGNFTNIFGCDKGGPFCHQPVTKARVQSLLKHVAAGGTSNGVGLTQLTWPGFIRMAERLGGAHIPKNQLKVGFSVIRGHLDKFGETGGLASYNAGDPLSLQGRRYARKVQERQAHWHKVLMG